MDSKGRNVIVCDNGTGVSRKCEKKQLFSWFFATNVALSKTDKARGKKWRKNERKIIKDSEK